MRLAARPFSFRLEDPTAATRFSSPPFAGARVHRGALVPPASNPIVLRHVIDRAGGTEARAARMRPGPGFCALSVREVGHAWAAASGGHRRNGRREPGERGKNRNQIPADCALAGCTATLGLGIAPFSSGTRSGFGRPGHITTASPPSPGGGHAWRRPGQERPGGTGRKAPCGKRSQPAKADGMPRVGAGGRPAAPRPLWNRGCRFGALGARVGRPRAQPRRHQHHVIAVLKTTKDHKRGAVRDGPRPGRAGGAVIAVSSRGYRGEPRRCLRQRHHRCHFEGDLDG